MKLLLKILLQSIVVVAALFLIWKVAEEAAKSPPGKGLSDEETYFMLRQAGTFGPP